MWRRLRNVRVWLAAVLLAVLCGAGTPAPAGAAERVEVFIYDFGAGQPWYDVGTGSPVEAGRMLQNGQYAIRVLMPGNARMDAYTHDELVDVIARELEQQILAARQKGVKGFQIELVENIGVFVPPGADGGKNGKGSYWSATQQARAAKFGRAAYEALGRVLDAIETRGDQIDLEGAFGSNGTAVFARAIEGWAWFAHRWRRVTFVDGRAFGYRFELTELRIASGEMQAVIEQLGALKVRAIVTHGDLPAPPGSIGQLDTWRELQRQHPGLAILELKPVHVWDYVPGRGHIRALADPDSEFEVRYRVHDGLEIDLGRLRGRDLFPQLAGRSRNSGPGRVQVVERLLDALNRMAWGAVGTTVAGPAGGAVAAEIGDAVAKTGRALTFRAFLRAVVRDRGLDREMVANFHTLNRRRLASGLAPLSVQEFYGFDRDILDALDRRAIREANARYGLPESPPRPEPTLVVRRTRIERWSEVCRAGVCTRTPLPVAIPVPVTRPGPGYAPGGEARTAPPPAGGPALDDVALSRPDRDLGGASAARALPDTGTGSGGVLRPRPEDAGPFGDCETRNCRRPRPGRHEFTGGQQPPPPPPSTEARRLGPLAATAGGDEKGVRVAPRPAYAGELSPDLTAGILAACDFSNGPVCDLSGKE